MSRHRPLTNSEMVVGLALVAGASIWLFLPVIGQQQSYHQFADSRAWRGIPNAADVLSSLAFVAVGLLLMLVVGPASVFYWQSTGDLSLYVVVQYGGMAGMLLLLSLTKAGHDPFPWWTLMAWYAVSKLMESGDTLIWIASREIFAGHALKYLAAAIGGLAIANALHKRTPPVLQNVAP